MRTGMRGLHLSLLLLPPDSFPATARESDYLIFHHTEGFYSTPARLLPSLRIDFSQKVSPTPLREFLAHFPPPLNPMSSSSDFPS